MGSRQMPELEANLIRRSQRGEAEAFGELAKMFAGRAIGVAYAMLGSHEDALEASQDAFVRSWRHIKRFRGEVGFFSWYGAILRNVCVDKLRRRRRRWHVDLIDEPTAPHAASDPALLADQNEQTKRLWEALLQLPSNQREVLVMNHFQEMRYAQIAELLSIPIGTVMSRLHSARSALRSKLVEGRQ